MNEQVSDTTHKVALELGCMTTMVQSLEDSAKRLDHLPAEAFTPELQASYAKLQERLFTLSK